MKVKPFQKALSYLFPVKIWKGSSALNPVLELFLFRGHWQLTTEDAIYSDGIRYRPLALSLREIRNVLPGVNKVLVLGSGIGSAVRIIHHLGYTPDIVLVDNDEEVLGLAIRLLGPVALSSVAAVCADARQFVVQDNGKYDLLMIDLFTGRKVPEFVSSSEFLEHCRQRMSPGATIIINYMLNTREDLLRFEALQQQFTQPRIVDIGINKVLIATV